MSQHSEFLKLKRIIKSLRSKNAELKKTIEVIQNGEVDVLVIAGPKGERICTLQSLEQPYRELVEAMNEGAVTISSDGIILYCNARFQSMTGISFESLVGSDFRTHVRPASQTVVESLFRKSRKVPSSAEVLLQVENKNPLPVQLSVSTIELVGSEGFCIIATDLSAQKQSALVTREYEWLGNILNLLPVPLILLSSDLTECKFINLKASEFLDCLSINETCLPLNSDFLSFETEKGEVSHLKQLLKRLNKGENRLGVETILSRNGNKIPVLLFSETLPPSQGREPVRLLMFQDISFIKKTQTDLAVALRGRDQFLAALSHELRTPLNVILGWVQLLRANPDNPSVVVQALDTLDRNAELQRDLIEDLLDMSRILTGNLVIHLKPLDLNSPVKDAITSLQIKLIEKSLKLEVSVAQEKMIVYADDKRMKQLFSNLLHNAIKFTPANGSIQIRVEVNKQSGFAEFTISDSGQGIEAHFIPSVFDQFKQENMATNRSYGGLGLGLAICKTIVEQHKGEISVTSAGRGKGARFKVLLPLFLPKSNAFPVEVNQNEEKINLSGLKVLVVDDSHDNLNLFKIWLLASGAEVSTQNSATGIIDHIQSFKPHVLLSDISMPGEDGFALISKVRKLPPEKGGKIPAGAITANARNEDKNQTIAAGFQIHISKPVTSLRLVSAVKALADLGTNPL